MSRRKNGSAYPPPTHGMISTLILALTLLPVRSWALTLPTPPSVPETIPAERRAELEHQRLVLTQSQEAILRWGQSHNQQCSQVPAEETARVSACGRAREWLQEQAREYVQAEKCYENTLARERQPGGSVSSLGNDCVRALETKERLNVTFEHLQCHYRDGLITVRGEGTTQGPLGTFFHLRFWGDHVALIEPVLACPAWSGELGCTRIKDHLPSTLWSFKETVTTHGSPPTLTVSADVINPAGTGPVSVVQNVECQ